MKKIILLIIVLSLLLGGVTLAQGTGLSLPGLTPDSPFYFLDTLGEKIGLFFAFGAEKKAVKALKYAEEKLAEAKAMAEENKTKAIERANQNYQEFLNMANQKTKEAKGKGKDVEELATLITEATLRHQGILIEVFEKVPEEAKIAIEKAIEVSRRGSEEAVQAVTGAKKEELEQKIEEVLIIADWKTYINEKYGYSFKYPLDCFYGAMLPYCKQGPPEERPPECLCFLDGGNPDRAFLQAFTGPKDRLVLATFSVSYYDTYFFNPPPDTDLIEWIKERYATYGDMIIPDKLNFELDGVQTIRTYSPASPMAPSDEGIYFMRNGKLLEISMLSGDMESNTRLYNQILSTFKFIEPELGEVPEVEERPYIKLVSPNGGEVLEEGQECIIRWESGGLKEGEEEIRITIWREDGLNGEITAVPASWDFYLWKVETELENWAFGYLNNWVSNFFASFFDALKDFLGLSLSYKYKITVYAPKSNVSDQSDDYFTVVKRDAPDLSLGEELYQIREGFAITICNKGNKDLYESNKKIEAKIESSLPPWSTRTFTPITKTFPIIDANLKVEECQQGTIIPYSEFNLQEGISYELEVEVDPSDEFDELTEGAGRVYYFTVPEPQITLVSPNGGETWEVGNTYTIQWESIGLAQVRINLLSQYEENSYNVNEIASNLDAAQGFYLWTIPQEIPNFSSQYSSDVSNYPGHKIEVVDSRYGRDSVVAKVFSDRSDGCFKIIETEAICSLPESPVLKIEPPGPVDSGTVYIINWSTVSEATGYTVQRDTALAFSNPSRIYNGSLDSVKEWHSPDQSTLYHYKVRAENSCGNSSWSNIVGIWVEAPTVPETPVLTDPGISVNKHEAFTLNWTSVEEARRYWLQRDTSTNFSIPAWYCETNSDTDNPGIGTSAPEVTTTYYYRVKACDDQRCSAWSNIVDMQVIVPSTITVTSPNGGEEWTAGQTYDITWQAEGIKDNFEIYLRDDRAGPTYELIATELSPSLRKYSWTISNDIIFWINGSGSAFKIQVRELGGKAGGGPGEGIFDESDNYFSIALSL